ncbi:hypothetical protein SLA2020_224920 [Shorea laevis]
MSPTQFHDSGSRSDQLCPTALKIKKDSHFISKSSPLLSSTSLSSTVSVVGSTKPQQHRHPVIIYTHSPKVIHTHPRDFMALVQKLTGMSSKDAVEQASSQRKPENANSSPEDDVKNSKNSGNGDIEPSLASTRDNENCDRQMNSCFLPPICFDTPPPPPGSFLTNAPAVFMPNSGDLLCTNTFYNYGDSFYLAPNMMTTLSSSSTLDDMNEFPDY